MFKWCNKWYSSVRCRTLILSDLELKWNWNGHLLMILFLSKNKKGLVHFRIILYSEYIVFHSYISISLFKFVLQPCFKQQQNFCRLLRSIECSHDLSLLKLKFKEHTGKKWNEDDWIKKITSRIWKCGSDNS